MDPLHPTLPWPLVFECFLLYCVVDACRKVAPDTADGYVSAVLKTREHMLGDYNIRSGARTPLYTAVLRALNAIKQSELPKRLTARIPFTIPLILWAFSYILGHYPDPAFQRMMCATLAAGHAFSLRPGEFLHSTHNYAAHRFLQAHTTYAWFSGVAYPATELDTWPSGFPTHISSMLDIRKNTLSAGGPVAVAANPACVSDPSAFCCVRVLTDYIRGANLKTADALFTYQNEHVNTVELTHVMKTTAIHYDVDPDRVVPACLRKNVITQMELNTPTLQRQLQGGWRSNAGEVLYWANLSQVADSNQTAVHNTGCATAEVIRNIFSATNVLPGV